MMGYGVMVRGQAYEDGSCSKFKRHRMAFGYGSLDGYVWYGNAHQFLYDVRSHSKFGCSPHFVFIQ